MSTPKSEESANYLIAVGLDGSNSSWKAFDEAVSLTKQKHAHLHVISIQEELDATYNATEALSSECTARENLERLQIKARMNAEEAGIPVTLAIANGTSAGALVDYVKKHHINMLVVGDTGHSSIWGALLGTTSEKIVRHAPCSVLIVR